MSQFSKEKDSFQTSQEETNTKNSYKKTSEEKNIGTNPSQDGAIQGIEETRDEDKENLISSNQNELSQTEGNQGLLEDPWEQLSLELTPVWKETLGERLIVFKKPQATDAKELTLLLSDLPMEKTIRLELFPCESNAIDFSGPFERIANGQYFSNEPGKQESDDPLQAFRITTSEEDGKSHIVLELELSQYFVVNVYANESHYFLALHEPRKVFDRMVVLDAGHGGWDLGTHSYDGKQAEKDINLLVVLKLSELLEEKGIKTFLTRDSDQYVDHTDRISFANSIGADMFLSIHCNNAYKNEKANGTEVLYTQYQNQMEGLNSKKLSTICLEELVASIGLTNRGLVARGDDLTVLSKAQIPATLVELGFMSNKKDMEILRKEETIDQIAEALCRATLRAYEENE